MRRAQLFTTSWVTEVLIVPNMQSSSQFFFTLFWGFPTLLRSFHVCMLRSWGLFRHDVAGSRCRHLSVDAVDHPIIRTPGSDAGRPLEHPLKNEQIIQSEDGDMSNIKTCCCEHLWWKSIRNLQDSDLEPLFLRDDMGKVLYRICRMLHNYIQRRWCLHVLFFPVLVCRLSVQGDLMQICPPRWRCLRKEPGRVL